MGKRGGEIVAKEQCTYTKESLVEVIRRYCQMLSDRADEMVGDMKGLQSITFTLPVTMDEIPRWEVEKTVIDLDAISAIWWCKVQEDEDEREE